MINSILLSIKKVLGIDSSYTAFDEDILMHINSVFSNLTQLGLGPSVGATVTDATDTWSTFFGANPKLNAIRSYVYLRVRLLFDPPTTSYLISAMNDQIREIEWRLNVTREETDWVDPNQVLEESA